MQKIDKSKWPRGPWDDEVDNAAFDTAEGLHGVVIRHSSCGHLCGYVGVPQTHSAFGKEYSDLDIDAHGGLTYSAEGKPEFQERSDYWYFGFDCAHLGDYAPGMHVHWPEDTYRTEAYVRNQIASVSKQLAGLA